MKQLIKNKKEVSFQRVIDLQNTPYAAKYGKQGTYHAHHHSVALNSPQYTQAVSSSTGSTHELKAVSNRLPKSGGKLTGQATPNIQKGKGEGKNKRINDLVSSKTKGKHTKAASVTNYHHSIEAYNSKTKSNAFNQKPTYIILTIDNSGDKGSVKRKETPKSSIATLSRGSYAKQGQSYQQLSNFKKSVKKRPIHHRTKSDHIIKSKPSINFKLLKGQICLDSRHAKNMSIVKNKVGTTKSSFTINPPGPQKISQSSSKFISIDL